MQTKEIYFTSNDGKSRIHAVEWIPDGRPKAILQLVHGMAEHIERYGDFAAFMTEHGYGGRQSPGAWKVCRREWSEGLFL